MGAVAAVDLIPTQIRRRFCLWSVGGALRDKRGLLVPCWRTDGCVRCHGIAPLACCWFGVPRLLAKFVSTSVMGDDGGILGVVSL